VRQRFLGLIRSFFLARSYLEVETPFMVRSPGIDPYVDAFPAGRGLYLITSPEFHMKRLLGSGATRIFQLARAWRENERGDLHLPEFTMLEWYAAGEDYRSLMAETEELVAALAAEMATPAVRARWALPFARLTVDAAFGRATGWEPSRGFDADRFFSDLVERVEPSLAGHPALFLHDFPLEVAALARRKGDDPLVAERFELYLEGVEICNGFSELTDAAEQEGRFLEANRRRRAMGKAPYPLDRRFLDALQGGIPPCAGNALGVDRLLMLLLGKRRVAEVLPFPPE
jgi:lysyl-tRNA synthetase class 2